MPERSTYRRIIITGLIVLGALAIFAVIARRTFLRFEFDLVTYVDDSAGISPSSPVLLNGIGIGHVRRVTLSGSTDPRRTVRIDMRFNRRYLPQIPDDSTVAITAANLLGDKFVDISRGIRLVPIVPGSEIRSTETQDIGTVLARGTVPLKQVNDIFDRIDKILKYVDSNQGSLGRLINDKKFAGQFDAISAGVKEIEADFKTGHGAILHLDDIRNEAQKPMARLNDMMADLDHGKGSLGKLLHDPNDPSLMAEANNVMAEAKGLLDSAEGDKRPGEFLNRLQLTNDKIGALIDRIDSGQGTLGQLLVNPQLRDSLTRVQNELDSLTAALVKHPLKFVQIRFGLF